MTLKTQKSRDNFVKAATRDQRWGIFTRSDTVTKRRFMTRYSVSSRDLTLLRAKRWLQDQQSTNLYLLSRQMKRPPPGSSIKAYFLFVFTSFVNIPMHVAGLFRLFVCCAGGREGCASPPAKISLLPTAYVVRGKVMFWHVSVHLSVCPQGSTPPPCRGYLPPAGQQMEYLICRGRYASCVQAGGLSCFYAVSGKNWSNSMLASPLMGVSAPFGKSWIRYCLFYCIL